MKEGLISSFFCFFFFLFAEPEGYINVSLSLSLRYLSATPLRRVAPLQTERAYSTLAFSPPSLLSILPPRTLHPTPSRAHAHPVSPVCSLFLCRHARVGRSRSGRERERISSSSFVNRTFSFSRALSYPSRSYSAFLSSFILLFYPILLSLFLY